MDETRTIMLVGGIFGLAALALALPSVLPPALANEEPAHTLLSTGNEIFPPTLDPERLVKWDFKTDPGISTEPLKQSIIKKIGYGMVETVEIVETASGVYSSDALTDPHIQYPGIHSEGRHSAHAKLFVWSGRHWALASPFSANSFTTVVPFKGGRFIVRDGETCAITKYTAAC
jgi:hypothetical protein